MMRNRYAVFVTEMATVIPAAGMDICKVRLPAKRIETAIAAAGAEIAEAVAAMGGCNAKPVCYTLKRIMNSNPHGSGCADFLFVYLKNDNIKLFLLSFLCVYIALCIRWHSAIINKI